MLVYMNFGQVKMFYKKKIGRKNCYNKKDSIFTIRKWVCKNWYCKKTPKYQELDKVYEFDKQEDGDR